MTRWMVLGGLLVAVSASAQVLGQGAAQYPSPPLGRHFLDQPVATCVLAVPCAYGDCVILRACPAGTLVPPAAAQIPAPAPPVQVTPPIATAPPAVAAPRELEAEPCPACPVCPTPAPKRAAPKAAPKKC